MAGRGAWNNDGRGGTLKRLKDGSTEPGPYYLLAEKPSLLVGAAGRNALRDGVKPSLDDLAVHYGVRAIQKLVNLLGYAPKLSEDGVLGKGTDTGIRWAQEKVGVKVDGSVGPNTMKALLLPHIKRLSTGTSEGVPLWTVTFGMLANEGAWDPGAVGYVDQNDLGLAQINGPSHPGWSIADRFDPIKAIEFNVGYIKDALASGLKLRDAVLSYNLGPGGIRDWIKAGRPRYWNPTNKTSSPTGGDGFRDTTKYVDNVLNAYKEL